MERHAHAGWVCATKRSTVLAPDPAVVAARWIGPPLVRVVDLTRFFCTANGAIR